MLGLCSGVSFRRLVVYLCVIFALVAHWGSVHGFCPQPFAGTDFVNVELGDYKHPQVTGGYHGQNMAGYGNYTIVGAYTAWNKTQWGRAIIYAFPPGEDMFFFDLINSDFGTEQTFGNSVDITADLVCVGASQHDDTFTNEGRGYVFLRDGPNHWSETGKMWQSTPSNSARFGISCAILGTTIFFGATGVDAATHGGTPGKGAVYMYEDQGMYTYTNTEQLILYGSDADIDDNGYGDTLTANTNADLLLVGNRNDKMGAVTTGKVFVYDASGVEVDILVSSEAQEGDQFGGAFSVSDDRLIVISSMGRDSQTGKVYVFRESTLSAGNFVEIASFDAGVNANTNDYFGSELELTADILVVGSPYLDVPGYINNGAVSVYDRIGDSFVLRVIITALGADKLGGDFGLTTTGLVIGQQFSPGLTLEDYSFTNPCVGGAQCRYTFDDPEIYMCTCEPGITGEFCQSDIDDCASNPCGSGICNDTGSESFECNCTGTGAVGTWCQQDIDDCASNPCWNGQCNDLGAHAFECDCSLTGFRGDLCEIPYSYCNDTLPCAFGTCDDLPNEEYFCNCTDTGYTDRNCSENIDDCSSGPCQHGGDCGDGVGHFFCANFSVGWTGVLGEINIDDCASNPCLNAGNCTDLVADFTCTCPVGYTGRYCETDIDDCDPQPCLTNGVCIDHVNDYSCNCTNTGYEGANCEIRDYCFTEPCKEPGSYCINKASTFECGDPCGSNDCGVNGTCAEVQVQLIHTASCECNTGYYDSQCSSNCCDIDACFPGNNTCYANGTYVDCSCDCDWVDLNCAKFIKASTGGAVLVGNPGDDEAVQKSENDPLDFLTFAILLGAAGLFLCCLIAFLIFRLNKKKQTRIIDVSKGDDTFDKKYSMPA